MAEESMESSKTQNQESVRLAHWDMAKAVAIFLVVWGHCLQNMTHEADYWLTDSLSQLIISFHMPLFMVISGYFAYNVLHRPIHATLLKKAKQLLIPSITWYLVIALAAMIFNRDFRWERAGDIVSTLPFSLWFLKSLFMCYFITLIGSVLYRWKRWTVAAYALVIFAAGEWLNYVSTISMLPFFLAGIALHSREKMVFENGKIAATLCAMVFCALFLLWDGVDYNLYINPFAHREGYKSFIIRCLIGLSGAVVMILAVCWGTRRFVVGNNLIAKLGTMTLGVYCIQVLLAEGLFKSFATRVATINPFYSVAYRNMFYDYVVTPLAAIAVIAICWLTIKVLKKSRVTRLLFLGESK